MLSDFGVSKLQRIDVQAQAQIQQVQKTELTVVGTPVYMSPELRKVYRGKGDAETVIDYYKNDVFSLGLSVL